MSYAWGCLLIGFVCPRCHGLDSACLLCFGRLIQDVPVSRHFVLSEVYSSRRRRHADGTPIDNSAPPLAIQRAAELATCLLDPIREFLGRPVLVTSWYRSPGVRGQDQAVAGPEWGRKVSAHATGQAADLALSVDQIWSVLQAVTPPSGSLRLLVWDQLIVEGGCLHVASHAPVTQEQRQQILIRVPPRGKAAYDYVRWDHTQAQLDRAV